MIPVIASSGSSFNGAFAYYFRDKKAQTTKRVAWTQTLNMMTDCIEKAKKVMAYTAMTQEKLKLAMGQSLAGRKLKHSVFCYSLSWHPEEKPDKQEMLRAAHLSLEKLGLLEHEVAIAAHKDEPQKHIHLVVNKIHPLTGKAAALSYSKRKLSAFAREYEKQQGKVYCMKREENHEKRKQGKNTKYVNPVIAEAWEQSSDAGSFSKKLERKGYQLAQGRKRLVVVDPYGKTINPVRHLTGVTTAEFNKKLVELDREKLPTPEAILKHRKSVEKDYSKELQLHDRRTSSKLEELKKRQIVERSETVRDGVLSIRKRKVELQEQYGLAERKQEVLKLSRKLKHPTLRQRFSHLFFKSDVKKQALVEQMKEQQREAVLNYRQDVKQLVNEHKVNLHQLDGRHRVQRETVTRRMELWKPKEPSYILKPTREISHDHSGPTLSL